MTTNSVQELYAVPLPAPRVEVGQTVEFVAYGTNSTVINGAPVTYREVEILTESGRLFHLPLSKFINDHNIVVVEKLAGHILECYEDFVEALIDKRVRITNAEFANDKTNNVLFAASIEFDSDGEYKLSA